jgi:hypothetical protein
MLQLRRQLSVRAPYRSLAGLAVACILLSSLLWPQPSQAQEGELPTIHVPYFAERANPGQGAIFWFGKVEPASNYADVRIVYDKDALLFILHIFDRRAWYDETAGPGSDLTQYDSVSVYLDTQGGEGASLGSSSRRFDGALAHWQPRTNYQRAYTWTGAAWQPAAAAFETSEASVRGESNNDENDRGWTIEFRIPFAAMGLNAAPAPSYIARMALFLHDRDEKNGPLLPDQRWPPNADAERPATWGRLSFGVPAHTAPTTAQPQEITIRQGVDGATVPDAGVGGHSICGAAHYPEFFSGWGSANYAGYNQLNIQNQWDVADWPCFSKYYITFPLDALPANTSVMSATLTMYLFGNAGYGPGDAKPSYMQVARVAADWDEQTVTWNNGPAVMENYGWTWVDPLKDANDRTSHPYSWDLTRAVADAQAAGQPLRLAIYSTDGDYHSGKYFWTSDARDEGVRPSLNIKFGRAGYGVEAVSVRQNIRGGETARYELGISSLPDGETVTVTAGPSTPGGLDVTVAPGQISAPGGNATVTLKDTIGSDATRVYRVPVTISNGSDTRTTEIVVIVNGSQLFLPAVRR